MGEILSILIGSMVPISSSEIAQIIYADREDGGAEWYPPIIHVYINRLKRRLKEGGVEVLIESARGRKGYRFLGFRECEKMPESKVKKNTPKGRRYDPSRYNAPDKTNPVMKINKRFPPRQVVVHPSVKDAPWAFPARHANHESGKWDWNWGDYVDGQNPKKD
jgi:hypothetical protein